MGSSITTGGFKDQTGFNSVSLPGLGTSSTRALLNGRRMANFASPGDDAGVDLNNIPATAIERVKVLLDGASAGYGTDAIGGVLNFVTKRDSLGVQPDAGGAGDMDRDGFNRMAVIGASPSSCPSALLHFRSFALHQPGVSLHPGL